MTLLIAVLCAVGILALLILAAVIKTLLTPAKTSEFMPISQPEREETYAKKLSEMVQYETVSVRGLDQTEKFLGYHKVLERLFPLVHEKLERTVIDGNLLYKWKGKSDEKPIVLMSHQDVVEAEGSKWEHAPFSGDIYDGKVWGRGTADTKCSALGFFQAVEEMLENNEIPDNDTYLMLSCTEEIGGDGCPKLVNELQRRGIKPWLVCDEGGAIVSEPIAGCKGNFAMIGVVEKGQGNLRFVARSGGGHSSMPPKNTPIVRLSKFICDIEKHDPMKREFIPQAESMFTTMSAYGPFYFRLLFGNMWLFKPLLNRILPSISPQAGALIRTTIAFTMQSGSNGCNVIPNEAQVIANLRYAPHQGMMESIDIMKSIADKYNLETQVIDGYDYCKPVSTESDAFKYVEKTINKVFPGLPTCPYVMTGGTDARFLNDICDACIRFSPVLYGPEQMKGMHGLNECMESISLPGAVDFYKKIIKQ